MDHVKKFKFDALIKLRETERDEQKNNLARMLQCRDEIALRIKEYDGQLNELYREWQEGVSPGEIAAEKLAFFPSRREHLISCRLELLEELARKDEEISEKRLVLQAAVQQVKMLENLKTRREEEQDREEQRDEARRSDDQALRLDAFLKSDLSSSNDD